MNKIETNWTKEELQLYLLIYCANADFVETKDEIDFIKAINKTDSFDKIHSEFEQDKDFMRIQKIQYTLEKYNYSKNEIDQLIMDMNALFAADGEYHILEKNLMIGLKHILT